MREFVGAVAAGTAPPLGAADARAPVVMALAATRSARTGDTLRL